MRYHTDVIDKNKSRMPVLFPLVGFLSLVWFLVRVMPKPSRASYPCQRAAAPFASSFVLWLLGMVGIVIFFIKFHSPFLLLLVLFSLHRIIEAFRRHSDPEKMRFYDVPRGTRVSIAAAYFALAGFLGYLMLYAFETLG